MVSVPTGKLHHVLVFLIAWLNFQRFCNAEQASRRPVGGQRQNDGAFRMDPSTMEPPFEQTWNEKALQRISQQFIRKRRIARTNHVSERDMVQRVNTFKQGTPSPENLVQKEQGGARQDSLGRDFKYLWQGVFAVPFLPKKLQDRSLVLGGAIAVVAGKTLSSRAVRRAFYFWRRAGPMIAHYKFTQFWLTHTGKNREERDEIYERLHDQYAEPSLQIILHLKGLYCKIGQVLSTRPDFIPTQFIVQFATVQDSIPKWPVEEIEKLVRRTLREQAHLEYDDVFESIDEIALGSASIGQVHRAILSDAWAKRLDLNNEHKSVAIKVMHPGAKKLFANDFQVFRWLCRVALPGWSGLLNEFERRVMAEFDYRREAHDMEKIRENVAKSIYNPYVRVPQPEHDLCTQHLLVMEMLDGEKLVDALENGIADIFGGNREKAALFIKQQQDLMLLGKTASDTLLMLQKFSIRAILRMTKLQRRYQRFVRLLLGVHGHQIFVNGFFNGDPHPGNCLEIKDGRLGLIDFGQVRSLNDDERLGLARIICAIAQDKSAAEVAQCMREFGFQTKDNTDDVIMKGYATIFFDSDFQAKKLGFATPQLWFADMMSRNPLINIPEDSIFIARTSFLFRGMGKGLRMGPIRTSLFWEPHAMKAIKELDTT
eukprot:CAMPEP_0172449618 /NCGR_PEP_ID=MMETSP1065-20121228/8276_1 /TAXON_ID=265537 /ORGANISM="Amphiprora paludosa, Strain CCMP125" /LENGTH=654 /DNA_ID=CAMNT_0013201323 /DNA_START=22 /DNA_END=1986 /DNA_ORIENTATION=+